MTAPAPAPHMLCLGVNFRTAPVSVRERFAVLKGKLMDANRAIAALPAVQECVLLSTCNRTEIYLWSAEPQDAARAVLAHLLGADAAAADEFAPKR